MKKTLLSLLVAFVASIYSLQAQSFFLDRYYSSDHAELVEFYYNNQNLLEAYHVTTNIDGDPYEYIDSLYYDERGNVTRIDTYQLHNGEWIFPCYLEYTYDENNNRISRTNYNDFGGGHELQGIYTYIYENNVLTRYEMTLGGMLFAKGTYTYNEQNLLKELIEESANPWAGTWSNSSKMSYEYDEQGNQTSAASYYWNNQWIPQTRTIRTFDDNNNCTIREKYSGSELIDRVSYAYDTDYSIEDCLMPVHPEPAYVWDDFRGNKPLGYGWETANDGGQLVYICDYVFEYGSLDDGVSSNYIRPEMAIIFPNPASEEINISLDGMKRIEILDINGKTIMQQETSGKLVKLSVSELASGLYFVKAFNGTTWSINKIQIK